MKEEDRDRDSFPGWTFVGCCARLVQAQSSVCLVVWIGVVDKGKCGRGR